MEYHVSREIFNNDFELRKIATTYCKENNLELISTITPREPDLKFFAAANKQAVEDFDVRDIIRFLPISYISFYLSKD